MKESWNFKIYLEGDLWIAASGWHPSVRLCELPYKIVVVGVD